MTNKQVKEGVKVHHVDEVDNIGVISEVNKYYFMIEYPDKPKSILMNPYQAEWSEIKDLRIA